MRYGVGAQEVERKRKPVLVEHLLPRYVILSTVFARHWFFISLDFVWYLLLQEYPQNNAKGLKARVWCFGPYLNHKVLVIPISLMEAHVSLIISFYARLMDVTDKV